MIYYNYIIASLFPEQEKAMNILSEDKKIAVLNLLLEGCSIRTASRLTGTQRDTIGRLILGLGEKCIQLHDAMFRDVKVWRIEFDELWSYVGKKQKNLPEFSIVRGIGDQYLFVAFDPDRRAVISWHVGKRSRQDAFIFLKDLRSRILGRFHLMSDKFNPYEKLVGLLFGNQVNYGQVVKNYDSRGKIKSVQTRTVYGSPENISTTAVERNNLTLRMGIKRLARKTTAFSKKLECHKAAIALFIAYYNFCRVHVALGVTPAMAAGVTSDVWTLRDLITFEVRPL